VRLNRAAGYDVEEQALHALHTEHLRHRIREVLAALPDEQRRAIRLRLFEARSDAEIAPLLGVTPQRVSQLWNSGFTTLRSALRADPAVWWGTEGSAGRSP
jgi:RNA polymerase sigma factor (sigma-70 family)